MYFIAYFVLVIQVGLRWETGTDWNPYYLHFEFIDDMQSVFINQDFEWGYNIFVWFIKLINDNYSFFLLVHAIIYFLILFFVIKKYAPVFFPTLLLFYSYSIGYLGSSRQLLVVVLCLYGLKYVIEKKAAIFFFIILLASTIHSSAFVFMIYYFLNYNIRIYVWFTVVVMAFFVGMTSLPTYMFSLLGETSGARISSKVSIYTQEASYISQWEYTIFGYLRRAVLLFIFLYKRERKMTHYPFYNLMLNGYFVAIVLYVLFVNSLGVIISRGSLYFNIMEVFLLIVHFNMYKEMDNRRFVLLLLLIISVLLFYWSISPYTDLFIPYKGLFYNTDYYRIMY